MLGTTANNVMIRYDTADLTCNQKRMRSYHEQVQNINTQFYTGTIITNAIRQTDRQTDRR